MVSLSGPGQAVWMKKKGAGKYHAVPGERGKAKATGEPTV
jgi:hypothetical protein